LIIEQMRSSCPMDLSSLPWSMQFCNGLSWSSTHPQT
jgi:hypothetical protein